MPAVIDNSAGAFTSRSEPATWHGCTRPASWIRCNPTNTRCYQEPVGRGFEPAAVARLADNCTMKHLRKQGEEPLRKPQLELQGGRQMNEDDGQPVTESGRFANEPLERHASCTQASFVSYRARHLDREPKSTRRLACPSRINFGPVAAIK